MSKQIKTITNNKEIISKEEKVILDNQEKQSLLFEADALLPQKSIDRELEKFWIYGKEYTIEELKDLVKDSPGEYFPMFPNTNPFFTLMYKLCEWSHLNPKEFHKPRIVGFYIKKYIYARFPKDVLPSLLRKDNPIIRMGYIRKYKLFQYLNSEGLVMLEKYIKEANEVMQLSKDWSDFEQKYTSLYKLSFQLSIPNLK